jgi:hypothetical protein
VPDVPGADDGQMSSAPAIFRCQPACARRPGGVSGRCNSAVGVCARSRITDQVQAVDGSQAL